MPQFVMAALPFSHCEVATQPVSSRSRQSINEKWRHGIFTRTILADRFHVERRHNVITLLQRKIEEIMDVLRDYTDDMSEDELRVMAIRLIERIQEIRQAEGLR